MSLLLNLGFKLQTGYEEGKNKSEKVHTTQKVSHPLVNPKYAAPAPARPFFYYSHSSKDVNMKHEHRELGIYEQEQKMARIRRQRRSGRKQENVIDSLNGGVTCIFLEYSCH